MPKSKRKKSAKKAKKQDNSALATNRKALRDYTIIDTYETGIVLQGSEIKSIRQRNVSLDGSFARIADEEVILYNMHVKPYVQAGPYNALDPVRERKLLMHRKEIERIAAQLSRQKGTLIPLRLYVKGRYAKVALGLAKGKRSYEKRDAIRERESKRRIQKLLRKEQKQH